MREGWVYIMTNQPNGILYIGVTSHLARRIWEHREGIMEGFTKRYGLKRLVFAERHDDIRTAILGTVRTQIAFQVEHDDAKVLAARFAPLTAADLAGLSAYEIALRPCVDGATLAPVTGRTLPLPPPTTDGTALARASQQRWGVARSEVEAALRVRADGPARQRRTGRQPTGGAS